MRTLYITKTPATASSAFKGEVDDLAVLREVAAQPATEGGMDLQTMRKGLKVLDALDVSPDSKQVFLEEDIWEYLCICVQRFRWSVVDRRFIALADRVLQARASASAPPEVEDRRG